MLKFKKQFWDINTTESQNVFQSVRKSTFDIYLLCAKIIGDNTNYNKPHFFPYYIAILLNLQPDVMYLKNA